MSSARLVFFFLMGRLLFIRWRINIAGYALRLSSDAGLDYTV